MGVRKKFQDTLHLNKVRSHKKIKVRINVTNAVPQTTFNQKYLIYVVNHEPAINVDMTYLPHATSYKSYLLSENIHVD